jgi:hypothetical protein
MKSVRLDTHNAPWYRLADALKHLSRRPSENTKIGGLPRARLARGKSCLKIFPGRTRGEIAGDAA